MDRWKELLKAPISDAPFCAVDVETSGLNMSSRIVEIGAVRFNLAGERAEYQCMVNPCQPISPGATDIHGITDEMVKNLPRVEDMLPGLINFIDGCIFLAHNATFDVKMIRNELQRARLDPPLNPVICTILLARRRIPGPGNYRLSTLVDFLGIEVETLHNALPDAHAAMEVFLASVSHFPPHMLVGELPGLMGHFHNIVPPTVQDVQPTGDIEELKAAASFRLTIEMEYAGSGDRGPVMVTPLNIFQGSGNKFMKGYCHRDGITKTYRLDRIIAFRRI